LQNKTVVITGITGGIGQVLCKKFSNEGFNVAGCYLNNSAAAKTIQADVYKCDITNAEEVKKFISRFKRIDCLINNAGVTQAALSLKMAESVFKNVIDVNLNGAFWVTKEAAKIMMRQKAGSIINISSISSVKSPEGAANYSASKAALNSLTKTFARELGRFNITVNAVFPGFHKTAIGAAAAGNYIENVKCESVLNTTTDINELVNFVHFLAGLKSVSGQIFNVDSRLI
jgi:3-oxoacyl-[acyl-carrier protein] reductase